MTSQERNGEDVRSRRGRMGRRLVELALLAASVAAGAPPASAQTAGAPPASAQTASGATPATAVDAAAAGVEGPMPSPPPPPPAPLPPPGPSPAEVALEAEQAALKASLEEVQAELSAEREQRAEEVVGLREKAEKAEAALKKPPVSTGKGGVGITGFIQADWAAWRQSSFDQLSSGSSAPLNEERYNIRRARLRTTYDKTYYSGALELDGNTTNGSQARIVGAEASFKLPGEEGAAMPLLMGSIGLFKIPFGFEILQSDRDRLFLERSLTERALFPGEYDVGARLQGGWRVFRYALAVQNGNPLGERAFPGRDPNAAKDVSGRLGVETAVTDSVTIAAGVSGLEGTGFHPGTAATKASTQWRDANDNGNLDSGELIGLPGSGAQPSSNFNRFALGLDLRVAVTLLGLGALNVYGEVYRAKNLDRAILPADPNGIIGRDYRELGGYVAGTLDVLELGSLGVRYDTYNPDRDSTDPARPRILTDVSYGTLAVVAAVGTTTARFVVEYDHNSNHNGRTPEGAGTNLKDDSVIARGQVAF
jgi:hypothetical protein